MSLNSEKKVKYCFGKFGNISCILCMCNLYPQCSKLYWEWYDKMKAKKVREGLQKFIEKYCSENGIKIEKRFIRKIG